MLATHLRQAATVLLEFAVRFAPPGVRAWGQAMRAELDHVEGSWTAVMWSLGGASVMLKHALLSLLTSRGSTAPGDELFGRNISLGKASLAAGAACVLAALLFFAAPPFRQGLRVSLVAWRHVVARYPQSRRSAQSELRSLANRAETGRDPEGMVFVAARTWNADESARLAEEAVRRDPSLVWVYGVVAVHHPELPELGRWMPKLEKWDPQNALFPMIAAQTIECNLADQVSGLSPQEAQKKFDDDPAWRSAMAAVFASPKFDDYLNRLEEVDRRVVARYRLDDPYEALAVENDGLPVLAYGDSHRYAKSLLQAGDRIEDRGGRKGAAEVYWSVGRFGQVMDSQGHTDEERRLGTSLQALAYKQLEALSERQGRDSEAALFGYLAGKFEPHRVGPAQLIQDAPVRAKVTYQWVFGQSVSSRNAAVLQIAGLMMLLFSGLVLVAATVLIAGRRERANPGARRAKAVATVAALAGGVGFLVSSATVYLTYRPYWYILQRAVLTGETSQTGDLRDFLAATTMLPGVPLGGELYPRIPVYFWTGVTLLGLTGLGFIFLRHFWGARAKAGA